MTVIIVFGVAVLPAVVATAMFGGKKETETLENSGELATRFC